jgi:hypothetical protein
VQKRPALDQQVTCHLSRRVPHQQTSARTLTGRLMPVKNSGMIMGSTVASSSTRFASFSPAMSVHLRAKTTAA